MTGPDPSGAVLIVQHEHDAGPGQLEGTLAAHGLLLERWRPDGERELPAVPEAYAGVVVLGGSMGATDTASHPHLAGARELIADAAERDVPVLGLCLGAQLAALAMGGAVSRRPDGFCIGWHPAERIGEDVVMAPLGPEARLLHWHQDELHAPPGAVELLSNSDAFRLGSVFAIQAHPEVTPAILNAWLRAEGATAQLAAGGATEAALRDGLACHQLQGQALLNAWAADVVTRLARIAQLRSGAARGRRRSGQSASR